MNPLILAGKDRFNAYHAPHFHLGFNFVLSFEHLVDFCQVVGPFGDRFRVAIGLVAFLQMRLFTKYAHLLRR